jgi:hypothetical protein
MRLKSLGALLSLVLPKAKIYRILQNRFLACLLNTDFGGTCSRVVAGFVPQ